MMVAFIDAHRGEYGVEPICAATQTGLAAQCDDLPHLRPAGHQSLPAGGRAQPWPSAASSVIGSPQPMQ